jgi:hypothetical protein
MRAVDARINDRPHDVLAFGLEPAPDDVGFDGFNGSVSHAAII